MCELVTESMLLTVKYGSPVSTSVCLCVCVCRLEIRLLVNQLVLIGESPGAYEHTSLETY